VVNLVGQLAYTNKKTDSGLKDYRNDAGVLFYFTVPKAFFMKEVNISWHSHAFDLPVTPSSPSKADK